MITELAKEYLRAITEPLTKYGVEVMENEDAVGKGQMVRLVVIPKHRHDYGALIGENGSHANTIRTMMRIWAGTNYPQVRFNVLIPNPELIKTEYV